jgi:integrase
MSLKMTRPTRRADSSRYQYEKRIPADALKRAQGRFYIVEFPPFRGDKLAIVTGHLGPKVKFSLKTRDPEVAKVRTGIAEAHLRRLIDAIEHGAVPLSHKQIVALSGEVYNLHVERFEDNPGSPEEWGAFKAFNRAVLEGRISQAPPIEPGQITDRQDAAARFGNDLTIGIDALPRSEPSPEVLEQRFGRLAAWVLTRHGLEVDADTRVRLLKEVGRAAIEAGWRLKRAATGDYSDDPAERRFPPFSSTRKAAGQAGMREIVDRWWTEAKATGRKPSTYESYRATVEALGSFLGHDDARRVRREDVLGFKNHRLATINLRTGKPISPKTVKDSDLVALKAVFGWAHKNDLMSSNPAEGVTLDLGKPQRLRSPDLTDAEAEATLRHALNAQQGRERPKTFAAKKWTPWLMAYTGARLGEMVQLRKQDVRRDGEHWIITVTPEAGTVKTNERRDVVVHPHLIELGFTDFVKSSPDGHLFVTPSRDGDVLGPLQGVKNCVTEFVRQVVTNPNVDPNHGWRHRFKSVGREAGIETDVLDFIQGHKPRHVGGTYGTVTVRAQARALEKFPRYDLGDHGSAAAGNAPAESQAGK